MGYRALEMISGLRLPTHFQARSCSHCPATPDEGRGAEIDTVLPAEGPGFRTYNRETDGKDQVGLSSTIDWFVSAGADWAQRSQIPFQVGDISRRGGGPFPPHEGHRNGNEADLRPFRKDDLMAPTNINDPSYSRERTRDFVKFVREQAPGATILFNDPQLIKEGLTRWHSGHHNHLHLRLPGGLNEDPITC